MSLGRDLGQEGAVMTQESPNAGAVTERRRLSAGAIASISGLTLLVIFMIQNRAQVRLHFLGLVFTLPLWALTLISAVLGAIVWLGLGVIRRHRRRVERREARRA
jgi:uncharacterized integral membrane protein